MRDDCWRSSSSAAEWFRRGIGLIGFMVEKKLKREKAEIIKYNNMLWF